MRFSEIITILATMLEAINLTKKYGTSYALNRVNLSIGAGEVFCLLGQNGAGKTNHMEFLDRTRAFHERMRLYFYPRIFENASVQAENWQQFQPEYVPGEGEVRWFESLFPLLLITVVLCLLTTINLRKL